MSGEANLPFSRGKTYFGATPADSNDGGAILGQEFEVNDTVYGTGRKIRVRAVRNATGVTIYGKALALLNALGTTIIGIARTDAARPVAPIDELLPSTGCLSNDICWVVVKGPALCKSQIAVADANVVAAGDLVNCATINVSTLAVTTGGRIKTRVLSSAVTAAQTESEGVIGRAISSIATSGVTDTGILVDIYPVF